MASHPLIDGHLAALGDHLPAPVVDELADGLLETWDRQMSAGKSEDAAARMAIHDFGDPTKTVNAFVAQAPGRRLALRLLFTAPVVAAFWAASLVAARFWTWSVPLPVVAGLGVALVGILAALIGSATSRHSYRRTRLGIAGGVGAIILDAAMVAFVLLAAPLFVWPMAVAIAVSLARITLTVRTLRGEYVR